MEKVPDHLKRLLCLSPLVDYFKRGVTIQNIQVQSSVCYFELWMGPEFLTRVLLSEIKEQSPNQKEENVLICLCPKEEGTSTVFVDQRITYGGKKDPYCIHQCLCLSKPISPSCFIEIGKVAYRIDPHILLDLNQSLTLLHLNQLESFGLALPLRGEESPIRLCFPLFPEQKDPKTVWLAMTPEQTAKYQKWLQK